MLASPEPPLLQSVCSSSSSELLPRRWMPLPRPTLAPPRLPPPPTSPPPPPSSSAAITASVADAHANAVGSPARWKKPSRRCIMLPVDTPAAEPVQCRGALRSCGRLPPGDGGSSCGSLRPPSGDSGTGCGGPRTSADAAVVAAASADVGCEAVHAGPVSGAAHDSRGGCCCVRVSGAKASASASAASASAAAAAGASRWRLEGGAPPTAAAAAEAARRACMSRSISDRLPPPLLPPAAAAAAAAAANALLGGDGGAERRRVPSSCSSGCNGKRAGRFNSGCS
eukprot:357523-Chlamydomonas_euryale.AAC.15